jgi:hypothetical protein
MKSIPSLLLLMLAASSMATAETGSTFNPLDLIGLSYGASAIDVIRACQQAGLTITKLDTGTGATEGYFNIAVSGATYLGQPASLRLGGGGFDDMGRQHKGLNSVWAVLESDSVPLLRRVLTDCVESLIWTHGPSKYIRAKHEMIAQVGFAEQHFWRRPFGTEGAHLDVTVQASLEVPVGNHFRVAIQYALIDR